MHTQQHKRIYVIGARVMLSWRMLELSGPFQTWRGEQQEKEAHGLICAKILRRWLNLTAASALVKWQEQIARTKTLARLLVFWRNKTLASAFLGWEERVTAQKSMRECCQRVLQRMLHMCAAQALALWIQNAGTLEEAYAR